MDKGYNNTYDFSVTYTDSYGKTFAETVALTVTDDANADVGTASTTLETSVAGRSSIGISKNNTGPAYFDLNNANHRDLLSQGAKDFIARHAGDNVDALNELFALAVQVTDTNNEAAPIQSSTNLQTMVDVLHTDASTVIQSAAISLYNAIGDIITLAVTDHWWNRNSDNRCGHSRLLQTR